MYRFNSSCSSTVVAAVGRWVTFSAWGAQLIWITVGQGLTVLIVGAGGGCSDIFLAYHSPFLGWIGDL